MTTPPDPAGADPATNAPATTAPATTAEPPLDPAALTAGDITALTTGLAAEDAAIYAYGTMTAFARADRRPQIAEHAAAHRARRESLVRLLSAADAPVPPAAAGYTLPFPVTDPASAARLAVAAEEDCAVAWRSALERADSDGVRGIAVDALSAAAVLAARWRVALDVAPPTVPFPGTPAAS